MITLPDDTVRKVLLYLEVPELPCILAATKRILRVVDDVLWSEVWRTDFAKNIVLGRVAGRPLGVRVTSWPGLFESQKDVTVSRVDDGLFDVRYTGQRSMNVCVYGHGPFGVHGNPFTVPMMIDNVLTWHVTRIAYFEIRLVELPATALLPVACVAIGVCEEEFRSERDKMPGWDDASYGFHSDDGHRFHGGGTGEAFTDASTVGDTLGCGIVKVPGHDHYVVFYTRNGEFIDFDPHPATGALYPVVGVDDPSRGAQINLGFAAPFLWNPVTNGPDLLRKARRFAPRSSLGRRLLVTFRRSA